MASFSFAPSPVSPVASMQGPSDQLELPRLTVGDVYQMSKDIAEEMHKTRTGETQSIVEKVVKTLEWLELYVEETEELRAANYKLELKADELIAEKSRRKNLQQELQGMQLVAEERGRQRDSLSVRISELEAHNTLYQQKLQEYEQNRVNSLRRQRYNYSSATRLLDVDEDNAISMPFDVQSGTKSLDRKEVRKLQKFKKRESATTVEQLEKELNSERKKVNDLRESRALEQRRIQQRLKHMDDEITELKKQLATAQMYIERLKEEKEALIERSEVLTEVKAVTLASIARKGSLKNGDSTYKDNSDMVPQFYKKDLLAILKERNELKEKICILQDELKKQQGKVVKQEKEKGTSSSRSVSPYRSLSKRSSTQSVDKLTQRIEDSMVIVDLYHSLQVPDQASRSSSRNSFTYNIFDSSSTHSVNSTLEPNTYNNKQPQSNLERSGSTSL